MSTYPTDVEQQVAIEPGLRLRFRALRACEEGPIRRLDARLSVRTRYLRFLSPMHSLPDTIVRRLACVDYRRSLAIVVENERAPEDVIALAGFSAVDDETAEVALVVRDDCQGRGVGTALVDVLLAAAGRRGFSRFAASITVENLAMRRMMDRVGRVVSSATSAGVSEYVFVPLVRPAAARSSPSSRR